MIGARPAGLQLGHLVEKAGRDYMILEGGDGPGAFFRTFPRQRKLISINKPHTGWDDPELKLRVDWNSLLSEEGYRPFTGYRPRYFPQADDMVRYRDDFAQAHRLRVRYGAHVSRGPARKAGSGTGA